MCPAHTVTPSKTAFKHLFVFMFFSSCWLYIHMYYRFWFCHRKHRRRRTAVREQEMYPGCEFVFCRRAKGEKGRSNTRNRVSCVGPFVSFRPFWGFFAHPNTQHRSNMTHWNIWHVFRFRCVSWAKYFLVRKSNRAICKIWDSCVMLPCLYIWLRRFINWNYF